MTKEKRLEEIQELIFTGPALAKDIDEYTESKLITQANRFVWIISIVTFILVGFALTQAQDASNLREQNKVLKDNCDRATVINGINNGRLKVVNDYFNPTIDTLYRGQKIKWRKANFNFGGVKFINEGE